MQGQDGNKIGSCAFIQINVTYLVSLPNKNQSNLLTNFMATFSKKTNSTKYLGVTLQSNLKWDKHINNITPKANQTLNFLKRNLKVKSQKIKEHAYKALVRPKLEYSPCIWDPTQTNQIKQLEKVQRRAARFTCHRYHNTSSVTNMLEDLKLNYRSFSSESTRIFSLISSVSPLLVNLGRHIHTHFICEYPRGVQHVIFFLITTLLAYVVAKCVGHSSS